MYSWHGAYLSTGTTLPSNAWLITSDRCESLLTEGVMAYFNILPPRKLQKNSV